jgi:Na+/H+-dicarboxylate symporter
MSEGTRVLVGLGVGLGAGLAIAASHSPALIGAADAVAPVGQLWVNAIRMTVIPLVVSLVITGVASAARRPSAIGRMGVRTLVVFVAMLTAAAILACRSAWLFSWLSHLVTSGPNCRRAPRRRRARSRSAPGREFLELLLSLIPTNPVAAAANGDAAADSVHAAARARDRAGARRGRDTLLRFFARSATRCWCSCAGSSGSRRWACSR